MTRQKWTSILMVLLVLISSPAAFSQTDKKVKRSVATMIFSGLGGAALGLSTLSFYDKPEEHTDNITLGALVGFLAGAAYIAYDSSRPTPSSQEYTQIFDQDLKIRRAFVSTTKAPSVVHFVFDF